MEDVVHVDDEIVVKLLKIDDKGKLVLSRKVLLKQTQKTENERKNRGFLWDNLQRIGRKVSGSGLSFAGRERQILFTGRSAWLSWTGYAAKTDGSDGKGNRICDQGTQERFL